MAISQEVKAMVKSLKNTNPATLNDGAKAVRKELLRKFDPINCASASLEDVIVFLQGEKEVWGQSLASLKERDETIYAGADLKWAYNDMLGFQELQHSYGLSYHKSANVNEYGSVRGGGPESSGALKQPKEKTYRELMDARQRSAEERIEYINSLLEQVGEI